MMICLLFVVCRLFCDVLVLDVSRLLYVVCSALLVVWCFIVLLFGVSLCVICCVLFVGCYLLVLCVACCLLLVAWIVVRVVLFGVFFLV